MTRITSFQTRWFAVVVVGVGLCGCGGSGATTTSSDVFTGASQTTVSTSDGTVSTPTTPTTATTQIPGLKDVGTITASGNGTTLREQISMGPIGYGAAAEPPQDALAPCGANFQDPSQNLQDGFAHGTITFNYSQGRLPLNATLDGSQAVKSFGDQNVSGILILHQSDGWECGNAGSPGSVYSFTLQPGQTVTDEFWIDLPSVVTNAQATLPQSELNTLVFDAFPLLDQTTNTTAATGPDAIDCGNGPQLMPFAQAPPFTAGPAGSTTTCKAG
jgi:hypothetical protein